MDLGETPACRYPEPVIGGTGHTEVPTEALERGLRREGTMVAVASKASPKGVGMLVFPPPSVTVLEGERRKPTCLSSRLIVRPWQMLVGP